MNSPISPNGYVPQTSQDIMAQVREYESLMDSLEAEIDKDCGGMTLEQEFLSGKTYPIGLSACCESNKIPSTDRGGKDYYACAMCGEPC